MMNGNIHYSPSFLTLLLFSFLFSHRFLFVIAWLDSNLEFLSIFDEIQKKIDRKFTECQSLSIRQKK